MVWFELSFFGEDGEGRGGGERVFGRTCVRPHPTERVFAPPVPTERPTDRPNFPARAYARGELCGGDMGFCWFVLCGFGVEDVLDLGGGGGG